MAFEGAAPEGWCRIDLFDVTEFVRDGTHGTHKRVPEGVPLLSAKDITDGGISIDKDASYITEEEYRKIQKKYEIEPGDTLLTIVGTLGRSALVREKNKFSVQRSVAIIRPDSDKLLPEYLYLVTQSPNFQSELERRANRTAQAGVYLGELERIVIPVPPLAEQKKIAEILGAVDDAIAKTKSVIEQNRLLKNGLLARIFSGKDVKENTTPIEGWHTGIYADVASIPVSWKLVTLTEVAKLESGHTPDRRKSEYWDGDVPWISLHDTKGLTEPDVYDTALKISDDGLANSSARLLPAGTVVLSRTATIGLAAIMAKPMATSQDYANFICGPKLYNRYLVHLFRWMQPVWKQLSAGSTHKTVYMPIFKRLQILLPPLAAQREIAALADAVDVSRRQLHGEVARLNQLKQGLMAELLSGRKRVTETTVSAEIIPFPSRPATLAAYICMKHQGEIRFGSQKLQKILHFCQYEAVGGRDFSRAPQRQRAGPYDPDGRRKIAEEMRRQNWFREDTSDGATTYEPLPELPKLTVVYKKQFSAEERASIDRIVSLLKPLTTDECGVYATLYASWNDFLLGGHDPSDNEIIEDVLTNWSQEKANTPRKEWKAGLKWLRNNNLVPKGTGPKTTRSGGQGFLV